ncbi:GNAT family N-acetyltransferase [Alkalilimnicola ehrlichii]|uniref:GNAT family N-acetyltransferase n=1 Tax=Alkalilimnicola ehrlichii TaxID=351052 RepID=A0A3E0WGM8_9GAMM|nr:GNAT family N-acetyltransferase [Alkalilimnicola ehrlichii]RFA24786.1 GNAT family N-acetyltransferase [Alkalilimnicola ehrlichii]RFA32044.1 GNAT family N-acetyltransferase [Alkalilimnicola ehrlichii]
MTGLRVVRKSGAALQAHLEDLARLRITVFRDFPYLYEGDPVYEQRYLQTYADAPDSVIVLVFDNDQVVGASSGIPLSDETPEIQKPFQDQGYDVERVFYCGESVLLRDYRGRGLGVAFFEEREAHAQALNRFDTISFCAVERPLDHPRRPQGYTPLDVFWQRRGYRKQPHLRTSMSWQDLDEAHETPKPMIFWTKGV